MFSVNDNTNRLGRFRFDTKFFYFLFRDMSHVWLYARLWTFALKKAVAKNTKLYALLLYASDAVASRRHIKWMSLMLKALPLRRSGYHLVFRRVFCYSFVLEIFIPGKTNYGDITVHINIETNVNPFTEYILCEAWKERNQNHVHLIIIDNVYTMTFLIWFNIFVYYSIFKFFSYSHRFKRANLYFDIQFTISNTCIYIIQDLFDLCLFMCA